MNIFDIIRIIKNNFDNENISCNNNYIFNLFY